MKNLTSVPVLMMLFFISAYSISEAQTPQKDRYPVIKGTPSGKAVVQSPDPLVAYRWENPKYTDDLEVYTIKPVSMTSSHPGNSKQENNASIRVTGDGDLMFDFGQVNAGWLEFDSENLEGEIQMSISEFNEPAVFNVGSEHPKKTARPVKHGNTYRLELNKDLYEGVRFGWIHIKGLNKPATISNVRLICQTKPTNYEGSFSSSDTTLNRIWYTGAYTVKLNLLKDYFGAILMERSDRHSWTGDAHTSQAASMVAFGNYDFVKANIRYTSTQFNGIASYSLYWVLSLIDYYNYTGDKELVNELLENACNKLNIAYDHYGQDPTLAFAGWDERLGAGFENASCQESQNLYKMLSIRAWTEFSALLSHAGHPQLAARYKGFATEKVEELRKDSKWADQLGIHAAADAVNAGFVTSKEQKQLWNAAFSNRQQRVSYSPFNQYFIITSLAKMKRHSEALTTVDDSWGGQLRYGATTFFEVFRPSWNTISNPNDAPINNQCGYTSLTHPWSAGVTKWLTEEILGIKPTQPGFATCTIKPSLSADLTAVAGSVPTLHGTISASFDIESGKSEVTVPEGVTATVGIPKAGRQIDRIEFENGTMKKSKEDTDFVYYILKEGNYRAVVTYTGSAHQPQKESFEYENKIPVKEDVHTQGNWKTRYGSKGYMLCNYDSTDTNYTVLPDFITEVKINKSGNQHWASNTLDVRALESHQVNDATRSIGAIITRDPIPCDQTMTIDVKAREGHPYTVSLYFVDWDKQARRSAIEVFDLKNKQLQMPVHMVRDYEQGKYVTYRFDQPVRIRINQVRGPNAALSGVFFD